MSLGLSSALLMTGLSLNEAEAGTPSYPEARERLAKGDCSHYSKIGKILDFGQITTPVQIIKSNSPDYDYRILNGSIRWDERYNVNIWREKDFDGVMLMQGGEEWTVEHHAEHLTAAQGKCKQEIRSFISALDSFERRISQPDQKASEIINAMREFSIKLANSWGMSIQQGEFGEVSKIDPLNTDQRGLTKIPGLGEGSAYQFEIPPKLVGSDMNSAFQTLVKDYIGSVGLSTLASGSTCSYGFVRNTLDPNKFHGVSVCVVPGGEKKAPDKGFSIEE